MIKNSQYFIFDGIKSSDMGISNVSVSSGLYSEPFLSSREIIDIEIKDRDEPYFQRIKKDPLNFSITLFFDEGWNENTLREVARWLDVNYYKPLQFSENINRIFYILPVNASEVIHNGLNEGYFTLDVRNKSSYTYSPIYQSQLYDLSNNSLEGTRIDYVNQGDVNYSPELHITKIGTGDVSIVNHTYSGQRFELSSLQDGEEIVVNGECQDIETNLLNTYRYDNHNDIFLETVRGVNRLQVYGNCKLFFQSQFKTLS